MRSRFFVNVSCFTVTRASSSYSTYIIMKCNINISMMSGALNEISELNRIVLEFHVYAKIITYYLQNDEFANERIKVNELIYRRVMIISNKMFRALTYLR